MNCKPGDLAIIVYAKSLRNIGVIVQIIARAPDLDGGPAWLTKSSNPTPCVWVHTGRPAPDDCYGDVPDAWLRPIRDNDGEDEMLRLAGKPQMEIA